MAYLILYFLSIFAFAFAIYNTIVSGWYYGSIQVLIGFVLLIGGFVIARLETLIEQNLFICKQLKKDKD
jgi:hypothetical protein